MKQLLITSFMVFAATSVYAAGAGTKTDFMMSARFGYGNGCKAVVEDETTDNVRIIACRLGESLRLADVEPKVAESIIQKTLQDMNDKETVCK